MRASDAVMHRRYQRLAFVAMAAAMLALLASAPATAADKRSGRERALAQRVQQLQQQKLQLERDNAELTAKLAAAEQEAQRLKQAEAGVRRDLAGTRKEKADLGAKLEQAKASGTDLAQRLKDAQATITQREHEKAIVESVVDEQLGVIGRQARAIEGGEARNAQLYSDGMALLERFKKAEVADDGGVFGLGRVEAFDTYQQYRDKFDAQRLAAPRLGQ